MRSYTIVKNLYCSPEIPDVDKAFEHPLLYCLCISTVSPFVLEILFLRDLSAAWHQAKNYHIIGIALTKKAATKAIQTILTPLLTNQPNVLPNIKKELFANYNLSPERD